MDCKQCAENLTAFLDAELSPAETAEVGGHLQTCASCADELQSLRKAAEYIESQIREIAPKLETWRLVQARIPTAQAPHPQFRFFSLRWHLAATMLAVFGIFGLGYMQYRQFEKKSLNSYVAKYVQERDARMRTVLKSSDGSVGAENTYKGNPFIEVNFTPADNPFLLEGR
jgi:hypothetical protein